MTPRERRIALEKIATDGRFAQFGQNNDSTTDGGSEACTHVCCQYLIKVWRDEDVTIDEISRVARYRQGDEGMDSEHLDRVFAHWKLPYEASWRAGAPSSGSVDQLIKVVRMRGPILMAINYGYYPLIKRLQGEVTGANGFAAQGGRSDLGFNGDHAVLLIGARWYRKRYLPRGIDPDHGSDRRPRVPDFDVYTAKQLGVLWDKPLNGRTSSGQIQRHVAWLPTKAWNGATA